MTLKQYFNLPVFMRLTRKDLAKQLTAGGCKITGEGVGLWVNTNSVPAKRADLLNSILSAHYKQNHGVDLGNVEVLLK